MYIKVKLSPEAEAKMKEIEKTIEDLRIMLFDLKVNLMTTEEIDEQK